MLRISLLILGMMIMGCVSERATGLKMLPENKRVASQVPKNNLQSTKLSSFDWRYEGVGCESSVKDQGACGACWTFATTAVAECKLIQEGTYDNTLDLSEQYLLECTQLSDCNGGYLEYSFELTANGGLPTEESYPYDPYNSNLDICYTSDLIHVAYENKDYYSLSTSELENLVQDFPLAIAVCSENWSYFDPSSDYGDGVGIYRCSTNCAVDHAVLLLGYTEDYWIIKNQWGSSWGQNGYIRISKNELYDCAVSVTAHSLSQFSLMLCVLPLLLLALFF